MNKLSLALLAALLLPTAATAAPLLLAQMAMEMPVIVGDLEITGSFARATLPNAPVGGVYFTVTNKGTADDTLISVATPAAESAELHAMKMEGDVMKMNAVDGGLVIPAGGSVSLNPGGYHVMLMGLKDRLVEGQTLPLTLTFEKAGTIELQVTIGGIAADAPAMDMGTMHHGALATSNMEG